MGKIAYFDCFSGISGNMVVGALIDQGLQIDDINDAIKCLELSECSIDVKSVKRNSIEATLFSVHCNTEKQEYRNFRDIYNLIDCSSLINPVKELSISIFKTLADAEAEAHNIKPENVHFHEVGAVDSIVDIVSAAIGLMQLNLDRIYASPLPMGRGFIKCHHGKIPNPAPGTIN